MEGLFRDRSQSPVAYDHLERYDHLGRLRAEPSQGRKIRCNLSTGSRLHLAIRDKRFRKVARFAVSANSETTY